MRPPHEATVRQLLSTKSTFASSIAQILTTATPTSALNEHLTTFHAPKKEKQDNTHEQRICMETTQKNQETNLLTHAPSSILVVRDIWIVMQNETSFLNSLHELL